MQHSSTQLLLLLHVRYTIDGYNFEAAASLTAYRTSLVGLEKRYRAAEEVTTKTHVEKVNGKETAKVRFPLVKDDDETEGQPFWVVDDTEEENVNNKEEEYIPHRRPPNLPRLPRGCMCVLSPHPSPSITSTPRLRGQGRRIRQGVVFKMYYLRSGCAGS